MTKRFKKVIAGCLLIMSLSFFSSVAMAASVPGKTTGIDVKLRKSPSTSAAIITKLTNANVIVVDKSGNWYKIQANKKTGWIYGDYVKLLSSKGTINANGVNFRSGPGTNFKVITVLRRSTGVTVLETAKAWNKVKIGSKIGYVSAKFVDNKANTSAATSNEKKAPVASTATALSAASAKVSRAGDGGTFSLDTENGLTLEQEVVAYARQFNGVRYLYGGDNPQTGFDCSGFAGYVYKRFGVKLNRSAEGMYSNGVKVSKSKLKPGDLLFFDASARKASGKIDHAGIYLGGDSFIHASSSNGEVRIQKLSEYRGTYIGAKRVI